MLSIITALECFALCWAILTMSGHILFKYFPKLEEYVCHKCLTFWATLIYTQNPFIAALAALFAYIRENYLNDTKL